MACDSLPKEFAWVRLSSAKGKTLPKLHARNGRLSIQRPANGFVDLVLDIIKAKKKIEVVFVDPDFPSATWENMGRGKEWDVHKFINFYCGTSCSFFCRTNTSPRTIVKITARCETLWRSTPTVRPTPASSKFPAPLPPWKAPRTFPSIPSRRPSNITFEWDAFMNTLLAMPDPISKERKYQLRAQGIDLERIVKRGAGLMGGQPSLIWRPGKGRNRVNARSLICYWAVRHLGPQPGRGLEEIRIFLHQKAPISGAFCRGVLFSYNL